MIIYFNGRFLPKEETKVSLDDRGFLFADGAYEVILSYSGKLFKIDKHLERLGRSLRELRITPPALDNLGAIAEEILQRNKLTNGDATVYIQVTRGVAPRDHPFPESDTPPTVYLAASPFERHLDELANGIKITLVPETRWARCDIKSVALLPNVLASQQAKERGAYEAVFVRDGILTEGAHTNFCAVFDGRLVTHPLNNHILAGITRGVVLDLCRELDIPVREAPIRESDLKKASELMIISTISEIMPVVQVENWQVGNGKPGPFTLKLQRAFQKLVAA